MLKRLKIVIALSLVFSSLAFSNAQLNAEELYTEVKNLGEFIAALEREDKKIRLNEDIETDETIDILYDVDIEGSGKTISFTGDTTGWQGNYILQFYKNDSILRRTKFSGGDAAILVNGSELTIEGEFSFSKHEFGAIEVSSGKNVLSKSVLNLSDYLIVDYYDENYDIPFVWFDSENSEIKNPEFLTMSRDVVKDGKTQKYFYLLYQQTEEELDYTRSLVQSVDDIVRKYPHMARIHHEGSLPIMRYEDIKNTETRTDVADFIFFIITNMSEGEEFSFTPDGPRYTRATDRKVLYQAAQEAAINYRYEGAYMTEEVFLFADFYVYNEEGLRAYIEIMFIGHDKNRPDWEMYEKPETEFSKDLDKQVDDILSVNDNFVFDKETGTVTVNDTVEATTDIKVDFIVNFIRSLDGIKEVSIGNLNKFTLTDDVADLIKYVESYFNVSAKLRVASLKDLIAITLYDVSGEGVDYIIEFAQVDETVDGGGGLTPDEKPDVKPDPKPEEKPEDKEKVETTPPTGMMLSTNYYLLLLSVSAALLLLIKKRRSFN